MSLNSNTHSGPGAGQKVDQGENAPEYREGAGAVPGESLAAESVRSGGAFAENRNAAPGTGPTKTSATPGYNSAKYTDAAGSGPSNTASRGESGDLKNQESYAGTAPSYVSTEEFRGDASGPHGKNLTEGDFGGSGPGNSIDAEPGSKADPARLAEEDFKFGRKGEGQRQSEAGKQGGRGLGEQPYEALGSDEKI